MRLRRKKEFHPIPKIDTIVIIGNGFDRWQDLDTSYACFHSFYMANRDRIAKKLGIEKIFYTDVDGKTNSIYPVELIYGNPFEPGELDYSFWSRFEDSLADLDIEYINLFFGKEDDDLEDLTWYVESAENMLIETFCEWANSIKVSDETQPYRFGDNCVFINFNYTDTLERRFGISPESVIHIHGVASDKDSIVVGHSEHPQEPESLLYELGGRFRGLYILEQILHLTDKGVQDNIQLLCMELALRCVMAEEIKNVYVLGHSFGKADEDYFKFLINATTIVQPVENSNNSIDIESLNDMDSVHNRIQYAINRYGYKNGFVTEEMKKSIETKRQIEDAIKAEQYQEIFLQEISKSQNFTLPKNDIKYNSVARKDNSIWHISYFSPDDKKRIDSFMNSLGFKDYTMHSSIDDCISNFKIEGEK